MASDAFRYIEGLHIAKAFPEDTVRSTIAYKPQPEDLFIVTYPKCGTSWMQQIVYNILMDGDVPDDKTDAVLRLPFLEVQGADAAVHALKPGAFKTHLPFWLHPYSPDAKYIYVARNPYDCCVSFYHHTRNFAIYHYEDGTFDDFPRQHRDDANVLFVTYEDIKQNTRAWILRVAEFMGDAYGAKLREDVALLDTIVEAVSFESMKHSLNSKYDADKAKKDTAEYSSNSAPPSQAKEWHPTLLKSFEAFKTFFAKPMKGNFARKGIVGDWKEHFSDDHITKMKHYIASKTAGSDVMSLWQDIPVE
ncbi:hypothetical protein HPB49_011273 [Dermacentor silvarum]|uniref:Uncharacterized protein n=1 Tax=Dermacentor silvarum TaxID=543639 RepID=A0ACB8CEY1_DERSI|nr:hypothetical protein HPB49_011273 [Dermacentor silvarum]